VFDTLMHRLMATQPIADLVGGLQAGQAAKSVQLAAHHNLPILSRNVILSPKALQTKGKKAG
jgi:hypothetical protein